MTRRGAVQALRELEDMEQPHQLASDALLQSEVQLGLMEESVDALEDTVWDLHQQFCLHAALQVMNATSLA